MNRVITAVFFIFALSSLGCVPGESPIRITGLRPVNLGMDGTECGLDGDIGQTRGILDASGGGDYVVVLLIDSDISANTTLTTSRGIALTGEGSRNFVADQLFLTYRSENPSITFEAESIPLSVTIAPQSEDHRLLTDIIGDKAATRLRDMLTDPLLTTLLTVGIQLRGRLESGETVQSNTFSFPIEVTTSNQACPEPGSVQRTGPCGARGGQDGTPVICCPAGSPPSGC